MGVVHKVRKHLRRVALRDAVVVAGLGRCGTTMIYDAVAEHGYRRTKELLRTFSGNHGLATGTVRKTHAYPAQELDPRVKLLFLFGNPMDIALSTHRKINAWGREHHQNLESDRFSENDVVLTSDTMQLSRLFEAWYRPQSFPFASIRYEDLYDPPVREGIDRYLGFHLVLPPFRQRKTDWRLHPTRDRLESIYGELASRIDDAEPFKAWPARIDST